MESIAFAVGLAGAFLTAKMIADRLFHSQQIVPRNKVSGFYLCLACMWALTAACLFLGLPEQGDWPRNLTALLFVYTAAFSGYGLYRLPGFWRIRQQAKMVQAVTTYCLRYFQMLDVDWDERISLADLEWHRRNPMIANERIVKAVIASIEFIAPPAYHGAPLAIGREDLLSYPERFLQRYPGW